MPVKIVDEPDANPPGLDYSMIVTKKSTAADQYVYELNGDALYEYVINKGIINGIIV